MEPQDFMVSFWNYPQYFTTSTQITFPKPEVHVILYYL